MHNSVKTHSVGKIKAHKLNIEDPLGFMRLFTETLMDENYPVVSKEM